MTPEQKLRAAHAFWKDEEATDDQLQAVLLISQQRKFRPKTVLGFDDDRKARQLAAISTLPDAVAARTLILYHLAEQRPLMGAFLDALGIAHENGLIEDDHVQPDPEKLQPAVAQIGEAYPAEDVSLYLSTLVCQDSETWSGLADLPQVAAVAQ
jgi:hypothetical protein